MIRRPALQFGQTIKLAPRLFAFELENLPRRRFVLRVTNICPRVDQRRDRCDVIEFLEGRRPSGQAQWRGGTQNPELLSIRPFPPTVPGRLLEASD